MDTILALIYTVLWSSASVATKIGLEAAPPLILAATRFTLAGIFLWIVAVVFQHEPWPKDQRMGTLAILGFLNTTLYLGASFEALSVVSAGLFNLFVAINPLFVLIFEHTWMKKPVLAHQWWGLLVATIGLGLGSWQSIEQFNTPFWGVVLVICGQAAMASGSIYYHRVKVTASALSVNTWQLIWGATFLWPFALMPGLPHVVIWNRNWWGALVWLVIAVSIGAMLLWFRLLRRGAASASMWLLLTPIIGYVLGFLFLQEPVTRTEMMASTLVMTGLFIANNKKRNTARQFRSLR